LDDAVSAAYLDIEHNEAYPYSITCPDGTIIMRDELDTMLDALDEGDQDC
jgi:hypothetical protein